MSYILLGDLMKKVLKDILLLFLICFSFFYTEKVIDFINNKDPLMYEIINVKSNYNIAPVNAIIDDDTIIPGIIGREVDVDKSYQNMKLGGIFREDALIFKNLFPYDILKDNKNKYIVSGNNSKKEVALLFVFNSNNIEKINLINNLTIFINHKDLTINNINLLNNKEIYSYGNNGLYTDEILTNDNALIDRLSNNKSKYCITKEKNDNVLEICSKNNMYTVIPNIIGGYYEIKNKLSNGNMILLNNLNDVDSIIKYIKSKGYNIVALSRLLNE